MLRLLLLPLLLPELIIMIDPIPQAADLSRLAGERIPCNVSKCHGNLRKIQIDYDTLFRTVELSYDRKRF